MTDQPDLGADVTRLRAVSKGRGNSKCSVRADAQLEPPVGTGLGFGVTYPDDDFLRVIARHDATADDRVLGGRHRGHR